MDRRTLKLQESADAYLLRQGRVTSKPTLTLKGQWMHRAGFRAGQRVTVKVERGRLVIVPA